MFNKKPRRNFRQRNGSSSDEADQQKNCTDGDGALAVINNNKPLKVPLGRGISCSSRREATPPKSDDSDGEYGEPLKVTTGDRRNDRDGGQKKTKTVLSFSDDKEDGEPVFKLKKSSDKAVLFQVKKNAPSPSKTTNSTVIITGKEIEAARRQRCATREQKDFIPLGRDGQSSSGSTPDHYRRADEDARDLDDDDDDDDELDDHERRIEFAPRLKSIRERIAKKLGTSEDSCSGTDGKEQELWEETQIGKGVKRWPRDQSPRGSETSSCSSSSSRPHRQRRKKTSKGVRIPKPLPPINVSMVKRRITGKLDSLKQVHRARQAELRRMEDDVESTKTSVETLEESSLEKQLKFYRAMTLYIHNLVECLQEKVVEINSLELELHTLLSDQMEALLAQRRQKVKEQADHLQHLSYGTNEQNVSTASGAETQGETGTAVVAEADFNIPEDTQLSPEEENQMQKKKADILIRSQAVFSDVHDDFCNVKRILSHFEEWRRSYSDSYHSAYISLCLPKLLNPIIRHQLLAWIPLKDSYGDIENLPWFTGLETFCHGHGHEELEETDRETFSNVIERTVLPKITAYVELVWDPLSCHQSVCLSDVCHRLREDYSIFEREQSKPVKALIEAVVRRLRSCVDEDVFIPLYPKKFLEDRSSPQCCFRDQQFWMALKLLGNMGKWDLLLPGSVLKELMLDRLLNRYLMITLCSQTHFCNTVCACKKIADSLPLSWFSVPLPQLQNFKKYLVEKIHIICKQQPCEDPNTRSAVVEVLKVLSTIRSYDSIMAVAEKYHYEDLIYSHQLLNQDTV
ncbi:intron Large complex component GCFC2 isoform X2 [Mastacembelus armatus]|uniref:intron Large complex component GCFC2 isoform X2 n=1 Tax=Mastacembelus armatus TaxID=205130 RepID=UPI000E4634A8|nr:GC-rich sequence DNA-binding factor 2-like isoform X2 [Mastacembelus armatus]